MLIGIDLGGTKTEIVCLSESGKEHLRRRVASPQGSYEATIANLKHMVDAVERDLGYQCPVGLGMPGSINQNTGTVKNANSVWLNGRRFQADLEAALGRAIKVENDANCFALSEYKDGAAQGVGCVFAVIVGTGCGGGLMTNGGLLSGNNGLVGEWGHNPLPFSLIQAKQSAQDRQLAFFDSAGKPETSTIYADKATIDYYTVEENAIEYPGPACYCGKRGCLETWLSGPAFSQDYQRLGGKHCLPQQIIEKAEQGEELALKTLDRYYERFAKSLATVINVIDPDVIVCGGGMSNLESLYEEVTKRWDKYIFADRCHTELRKAKHGDSSGVRGAAWLSLLKNHRLTISE